MSRHKLFYIFLILMSFMNGGKWIYNFIQTPYEPIDFRGCYLSSAAYWQGLDPYQFEVQRDLWEPLQVKNHNWPMVENQVYATPLYPPQFVLFFGLYNLLTFKQAVIIQFIFNIMALFFMIWAVNQLNPLITKNLAALAIFSFRGTWYALDTGQPMLQVFALTLFCLVFLKKHQNNLGIGLLLGFICFKFTLLIPIVFYLLLTKQMKTILSMGVAVCIFNVGVLVFDNHAIEHLNSWQEAMQLMNDYLHQDEIYNGLSIIATSISIPLSKIIGISDRISSTPLILASRIIIPLLPYLLIWIFRKNLSSLSILFIASLTGICFGHHLIYDVLTLICYALIAFQENKKIHISEYILILTLTLPIGRLAEKLNWPILHYLTAVLLFIYFLFKMIDLIKRREKEFIEMG